MNIMQLFFSLEGRINRAKWWLGLLVLSIVSFVLVLVLGAVLILPMAGSIESNPEALIVPYFITIGILILLTLWPSICLYAKRWHDRDKSGWWTLILLVPMVGPIWALVECGCLRGTDGDNRFGPDPLG